MKISLQKALLILLLAVSLNGQTKTDISKIKGSTGGDVTGPLGNLKVDPSLFQAPLGFTPQNVAGKGVANGYAGLDGTGKVPILQLPSYVTIIGYTPEDASKKGQSNGYASLGSDGKVPSSQLPSGATLPSQSGQSGKVLGTDGSSLSWVTQSGGYGSTAFVVTATSTVITVNGGVVSTISGGQQSISTTTVTKTGGTDTGTFMFGISATGGTLSPVCYYTSGINPSNWTPSGFSCSQSSSWPVSTSTRETYTVAVTSGSIGSPTRVMPDLEISQTYCGPGLVLDSNGLGCKVDPAASAGSSACNAVTDTCMFDDFASPISNGNFYSSKFNWKVVLTDGFSQINAVSTAIGGHPGGLILKPKPTSSDQIASIAMGQGSNGTVAFDPVWFSNSKTWTLSFTIKIDTSADVQHRVMFTDNDSTQGPGNYLGVRFDTYWGDTGWQCVAHDGGGETVLAIPGGTANTSTEHTFTITKTGSNSFTCAIDGGTATAAITTHIPAVTTFPYFMVASRNGSSPTMTVRSFNLNAPNFK